MANNEEPSVSPSGDLEAKLKRTQEIESWMKRLESLLDVAKRCSLDVGDNSTGAIKFYRDAYQNFYKSNLTDAYFNLLDSNNALTDALLKSKLFGIIPSLPYISFFMRIYGLPALTYSVFVSIIFMFLLLKYTGASVGGYLTMPYLMGLIPPIPTELMGIPIWAALFAGLGSSIQIIMGTVADIKENKVVAEYKRVWYVTLPLVALVFGYLAYILVDLGLLILGSAPSGQTPSLAAANVSLIKATGVNSLNIISNETGNISFLAKNVADLSATGVESFAVNVNNYTRMVACFLAGYQTDWFINRLTTLTGDHISR